MVKKISTKNESLEATLLDEHIGSPNILKINSSIYQGIELRLEMVDPTTDPFAPDNALYKLSVLDVEKDGSASHNGGDTVYITSKRKIVNYKEPRSN
jgi:hypothetical protein